MDRIYPQNTKVRSQSQTTLRICHKWTKGQSWNGGVKSSSAADAIPAEEDGLESTSLPDDKAAVGAETSSTKYFGE